MTAKIDSSVVNLTTEGDASPTPLVGEAEITQGSHNTVWIISEPGLYKIMLRARNPKAEAFTRFVTHEVLPSIRRYGYYKAPTPPRGRGRPALTGGEVLERMQKYELFNGQKCSFNDLQFYCNLLDAPQDYFRRKQPEVMIQYINDEMQRRGYTNTAQIRMSTASYVDDDEDDETYTILVDGKVMEFVR